MSSWVTQRSERLSLSARNSNQYTIKMSKCMRLVTKN